uniref:Uncharacterized protein n=1 Tax=Rhipicephalus zambeziensis TaxID=60191 RepID=A0A224Y7F4_9ACAR
MSECYFYVYICCIYGTLGHYYDSSMDVFSLLVEHISCGTDRDIVSCFGLGFCFCFVFYAVPRRDVSCKCAPIVITPCFDSTRSVEANCIVFHGDGKSTAQLMRFAPHMLA